MMGLSQIKCCLFLVVCLSIVAALSASTVISDGVFESSAVGERRLLQAKKPCPVNFEFQKYAVITNKCKGPAYPPNLCCEALKEFACPFADDLNDLTNDCASTMFSYINLYGKYPPGLFASECREGIRGLECPAQSPGYSQSDTANANSGSQIICNFLPLLLFAMAALLFSMQFI